MKTVYFDVYGIVKIKCLRGPDNLRGKNMEESYDGSRATAK